MRKKLPNKNIKGAWGPSYLSPLFEYYKKKEKSKRDSCNLQGQKIRYLKISQPQFKEKKKKAFTPKQSSGI